MTAAQIEQRRRGGKTRAIALTSGQFCLVDVTDYALVCKHQWRALWSPKTRSYRPVRTVGKQLVYLYRQLLDARPGEKVDHINHDTLDNRRSNLRICTNQQNSANSRKHRDAVSSGFKGVCFDKARQKWLAYIRVDRIQRHLGRFDDEVEAAKVYDRAALSAFGEHALTNFLSL
jgi:hypothetical protein